MTIFRKERPKCRKVILKLCKEFNCSLIELRKIVKEYRKLFITDGLKTQLNKMIEE